MNMLKVILNMNINLKKIHSQLNNMFVYAIETFNTIKCAP